MSDIVDLLVGHQGLLQHHPTEALLDAHQSFLDTESIRSWAHSFNDIGALSDEDLSQALAPLLDYSVCAENWPKVHPSVLELVARIRELSLPRAPVAIEPSSELAQAAEMVIKRLGLSRKKRHEVLPLCMEAHRLICEHKVDLVVDIGSGQGYVSLAIAMLSGVRVVGIDSEEHNNAAALARLDRVNKQRGATQSSFEAVTHMMGSEDLGAVLGPLVTPSSRVLLLGLHACGDLSAHLLRTAVHGLGHQAKPAMASPSP